MSDVEGPFRVVIMPDILAKAFHDPDCKALLDWWRDGKVRPVLNHELLVQYARVLRDIGVSDGVLRRWLIWFTTADKAEYVRLDRAPMTGWFDIIFDAAQSGRAKTIVTSSPPQHPPYADLPLLKGVSFVRVTQYLATALGRPRE